MSDADVSVTEFLAADELFAVDITESPWGSVGCVVSYEKWDFHGVEILMIPSFPPFGG